LDEGLAAGHSLTLFSAPAGFGKTTCAAAWVAEAGLPAAWLSLDPADDDPARFFIYLLAALQSADDSIGREVEPVLRAGQVPPPEVLSASLGNDILSVAGRFLLVLDDFHLIADGNILQVIKGLVVQPPPALHLVLLTREDPPLPLARLRAHNQMTEIRARDLRFTGDESARFLGQVLELPLTPGEVARLDRRTEGWVAGLQLAGLSLRGRADPAGFIATLSGSHRHILGYLTEEVLSRQEAPLRRFLLETSILDRLNAELCAAVTGNPDSAALLEQIYHDNLFLIPLDDERRWYRYHHLFAEALRDLQSTGEEERATLHRRASNWYVEVGMPEEAIPHALAAAEYAQALRLIEKHALEMVMQWHVKRVDAWIEALPPAWAARSPRADLAFSWHHLWHGDYSQAVPHIARLERFFGNAGPGDIEEALQAEWLALQATLRLGQGEESISLAEAALDLVPEGNSRVRSLVYMGLAGAYQRAGADEQALNAYREIIAQARAAGNISAELLGRSALGLLALHRGELQLALETAADGLDAAARAGILPPVSTGLHGELGEVYYQRHQLDKAHAQFRRAVEVSELSGYRDAEIYHGVIRSRLFQIEGKLEEAAAEIEKALALMEMVGAVAVREEAIAQHVRVCLAQKHPVRAERALAAAGVGLADSFDEGLTYPAGLLQNSVLRLRLARTQAGDERAELAAALEAASHLLSAARRRHYLPIAMETLLLRAQIHTLLGDETAAETDYAKALVLGETEGFVSVFVAEGAPVAAALSSLSGGGRLEGVDAGYVRRILAAFPPEAGSGVPRAADASAHEGGELFEPLTERELEVLRFIRAGHSNREIAKRLVITLHTVKKHNSNIYDKLGVNSRTQAVAAARRLGLLR
jgi:LuxR family maltose regulon positive regulatory protein